MWVSLSFALAVWMPRMSKWGSSRTHDNESVARPWADWQWLTIEFGVVMHFEFIVVFFLWLKVDTTSGRGNVVEFLSTWYGWKNCCPQKRLFPIYVKIYLYNIYCEGHELKSQKFQLIKIVNFSNDMLHG